MKLRICYVNTWSALGTMQMTGVGIEPSRRIVEFDLTEDQKKAFERKEVGRSGEQPIYEDMECMYLVSEEDEN